MLCSCSTDSTVQVADMRAVLGYCTLPMVRPQGYDPPPIDKICVRTIRRGAGQRKSGGYFRGIVDGSFGLFGFESRQKPGG